VTTAPITVLLNPSSGGSGPGARAEVAAHFEAAGQPAEVIEFARGEDPFERAKAAAQAGGVVVAAGGDGTVGRIASALVGGPAVLGVLPMGTLNHFARDLKVPLDPAEAAQRIVAGTVTAVDVADVNGRLFLNNASIGIYPSVVDVRESLRKQGYRKWTAFAVAIYRVVRSFPGVRLTITAKGVDRTVRTPFAVVSNNEYTIEGLGLGSRASLTDGQLFVYFAPRVRARDLPMLAVRALMGKLVETGAFEIHSVTGLRIDAPLASSIKIALDGENMVLRAPLVFRARPGALKVIV
jgi:diacylglycerol kinase family enzyme